MSVEAQRHVAHVESSFQSIDVYDTDAFGRVLLLDGHIQLAELDEHAYHESLVRVAMLNMPDARRALVVGGGDGGAIRELCGFAHLSTVDMVEIDRAVIDVCREHLPAVSNGAFDDPRVTVHVEDAFAFMKRVEEPYDLIVLDSTDTYEDETGELSAALFTAEFYRDCARALNAGGCAVTQADNPIFCPYSLEEIVKQLGGAFKSVGSYIGLVPSFGGVSAFAYGTSTLSIEPTWRKEWQVGRYLNLATYGLAFSRLRF